MRSKKPLLVTLALLALLTVIYYIVDQVAGPQRYRLENPEREQVILLKARPGRGQVYAVELDFRGRISGEALIHIGSGDEPFYAKTRLKAGEVRAHFASDWLGDQVPLRYQPQEGVEGRLTILYRFIRN